MLHLSNTSKVMLIILLLAASYKTHSAPTHHLTIGVQGNTPTLIVTSSEVGITPQTISPNKKLLKDEYAAELAIDSEMIKKPIKTKFYKNQAQFNKKLKVPNSAKSVTKQISNEENSHKLAKSVELKEKVYKSLKQAPNTKVLETHPTVEGLVTIKPSPANLGLTTSTSQHPNSKESLQLKNYIKDEENSTEILKPTLKAEITIPRQHSLKINTLPQITPTATDNVKDYTTNLQFTTSATKQINDMPFISSTATVVNSTQPEEMSTSLSQNKTDTPSTPQTTSNGDNHKIYSATPTTLNPKDFEDITFAINNNDGTNAATTEDTLKQTPTEKTEVNDVVVQTQKTTQIILDKSAIKMENENDSDINTNLNVQEFIATTENENLLLTTIETNAFFTPSTPTLVTLMKMATTTTQSLPLSLTMTMTTTENVAADDNTNSNNNNNESEQQQQPLTMHAKENIQGLIEAVDKENGNNDKENTAQSESQEDDVNTFTTTEIQQQINNEPKSTESSKTELETVTTQSTLLTQTEPQTFDISKTSQKQQSTTTKSPDLAYEASATTTTTETVLKLIDLEKHVVLQQPSLLMAGLHDNGHDGLKNIKKKQLIDKHYVEALLHNKQDVDIQSSEEDAPPHTQRTTSFSPLNNHSLAAGNKSLLIPIKHGYLGPILMEEKTFHVIHHADIRDKTHHGDDIEDQLLKGHFVELKAKQLDPDNKKGGMNKKSLVEDKEMRDMQADQPVQNEEQNIALKNTYITKDAKQISQTSDYQTPDRSIVLEKAKSLVNNTKYSKQISQTPDQSTVLEKAKSLVNNNKDVKQIFQTSDSQTADQSTVVNKEKSLVTNKPEALQLTKMEVENKSTPVHHTQNKLLKKPQPEITPLFATEPQNKSSSIVLSTTVFQVIDSTATKTPMVQADTLFTTEDKEQAAAENIQPIESKISDIQIEVYDSTIDSIVASTNFKDAESHHHSLQTQNDDNNLGKTTRPPIAALQQERFTQYVIDRTEASTAEPINYNTIKVVSGKPEPAAIEIHINVSESFANDNDDMEFSYPQTDYRNNNKKAKGEEESYDDGKLGDSIKLKISSNSNANGRELRNDEILVVEIIDTDNNTNTAFKGKSSKTDELFITDVKDMHTTPPPPPPPPPFQSNFDRDSDTIFYISNTEVKVGESLPNNKDGNNNANANEERKLRLESQFFPANYMASTHSSLNNAEDLNPTRHLYEEDIILSSNRNQADSLKIYRNNNEPAPPLDVTYVGESIIEVEQSPDSAITTTYAPDQMRNVATPQADVIIQPAILPEISIGVPVIGELPPQIELKEIDFMPNEAQLHRSGIYDDNDSSNSNSNNDIDENTITGSSSNNNHDADIVSGNSHNNQRVDESSIQYGGDLIDESADGGFDGVEGSYPFGNPAVNGKSPAYSYPSAFLTKLRKQQQQPQHHQQQQQEQQKPNHVADYAHLYVNYGVNNMRKDELSADVKDSGEMSLIVNAGNGNLNDPSTEQNTTSFKDFLSKVSMSNATILPYSNANFTHSERMSNATAFSVMEDANDLEDKSTEDIVNLISLAIGLFIVILPVVVTCSMFWALRYLYKKYHSNLMDNGGYNDEAETKGSLNENGMEKGEFIHEPSSSPTNSNKDMIEKYQDTSNKPSTKDSNVKFSCEKSSPQLETFPSNTNTAIAYTTSSAYVSKKNETLRLSLTPSSPMTKNQNQNQNQKQKQTKPPSSSASSPLLVVTTSDYINTIQFDVVSEDDYDGDDVVISGPNGSITKMTMENNLLTVETEERNDISRVARETKMDYNKDGVFVVEVARGIDSKNIPESPVTEGNEKLLSMFETKQNNGGLAYKMTNEKNCLNNEKVQIHSPPPENKEEEGPRSLHQIEEVDEPTNSPQLNENNEVIKYNANTGLSQSDLSSTSSSDSNKGYCYGNQELYVLEKKVCSTNRSPANKALKCDAKDIKDDDRNPENDQYLKHSPNKREELNKNKEDIAGNFEKSEDEGVTTSSGESPEQQQDDEIRDNEETKEAKEEQIENCEETEPNCDVPEKIAPSTQISEEVQHIPIPVEIEIHITAAQDESLADDTTLCTNDDSKAEEPAILEANHNKTQPVKEDSIQDAAETCLQEEQELIVNAEIDEVEISAASENLLNNQTSRDNASEEHCETLNNDNYDITTIKEELLLETTETNESESKQQIEKLLDGIENEQPKLSSLDNKKCENQEPIPEKNCEDVVTENGLEVNANGSTKTEDTEYTPTENLLNTEAEMQKTKHHNGIIHSPFLTNGTTNLEEHFKVQQLLNGHAEMECNGHSMHETENGFDSILSLPEPPPTTDEQANSDLSDQQLDSLPPPPPPEIFALKDLPPPLLTNGNADSPQSEESTNFYNILPPPPPTSLEVMETTTTTTAANGKVHASPLTPPASPPAHFTNNLHAGLCAQPIAVDVNGS